MRAAVIGLLLSAVLARHASAYDAYDPANCNGADWDDKLALTVSKVTAQPRVNFIKSPYDDDFTAAACPAATKACQRKSYLVMGDLVLVGKTRGHFTCVSYQSPLAKTQIWSNGWLPSAALTRSPRCRRQRRRIGSAAGVILAAASKSGTAMPASCTLKVK
jgi:hypothetical protein